MILVSNDTALGYRGIHPNLDLALEHITPGSLSSLGDFLVVFPDDAHKIKMRVDGPATVSKAMFKVKINACEGV